MESPEEFRQAFAFLESNFLMRLARFDYAQDFFGNIWAEYQGSGITIKIVRDRGILETYLSRDRVTWRPLDSLLQAIGAPPSVSTSSGRWPIGADPAGQAAALKKHLPSLERHLVGA